MINIQLSSSIDHPWRTKITGRFQPTPNSLQIIMEMCPIPYSTFSFTHPGLKFTKLTAEMKQFTILGLVVLNVFASDVSSSGTSQNSSIRVEQDTTRPEPKISRSVLKQEQYSPFNLNKLDRLVAEFSDILEEHLPGRLTIDDRQKVQDFVDRCNEKLSAKPTLVSIESSEQLLSTLQVLNKELLRSFGLFCHASLRPIHYQPDKAIICTVGIDRHPIDFNELVADNQHRDHN